MSIFFDSGGCHGRCFGRARQRAARQRPDRWIFAGCSSCCMMDLDGDGFITEQDMRRIYDYMCLPDDQVEECEQLQK